MTIQRGYNMKERVEFHCHTKMSRMAGLIDERKLIEETVNRGMSAVAVTDNNTVQGIPAILRKRKFGEYEENDPVKVLFWYRS